MKIVFSNKNDTLYSITFCCDKLTACFLLLRCEILDNKLWIDSEEKTYCNFCGEEVEIIRKAKNSL